MVNHPLRVGSELLPQAKEVLLTGGVVRVLLMKDRKIEQEMEMWFVEASASVVPICVINPG